MRSGDAAVEPMMHTEVQFSFSPIYTRIGDQKTWVRVLIFKRFNDNQKIVWCTFFCDFINRSYLRSKVWSEKSSKNENDTKFSAHQSVLSILIFCTFFKWQVKVLRPLFEPQQLVLVVKSQPLRHAVILSWWMVACLLYLHYPFKIHRDNLAGEEKMGPRVKRSEK